MCITKYGQNGQSFIAGVKLKLLKSIYENLPKQNYSAVTV